MASIIKHGGMETPSITLNDGSTTSDYTDVDEYESQSKSELQSEEHTPKRARGKQLRDKTKSQAKKLFSSNNTREDRVEDGTVLEVSPTIGKDPAFNPDTLSERKTPSIAILPENAKNVAKTAAKSTISAIAHPKKAISKIVMQSTSSKLSSAHNPFISPEESRRFLRVHDDLYQADSSQSLLLGSDQETDEEKIRHYRSKFQELQEHRENLRVAYTTSRHIERVRVVPKRHLKCPKSENFVEKGESGETTRFRWERYLGHMATYHTQDFTTQYVDDFDALPFDIETLSRTIERLLFVSAPWQACILSVRSVYRWDDPRLTSKWLLIYCIIWYTEHIMGFVYGYIIYITVRNRFFQDDVSSARESVGRVLDRSSKATHWGEMIQKYGQEKWLEPLLDELGPYLQLQLGDLANLLEVLSNFYTWKDQRLTAASLIFFAACLFVTLLADMRYCVKIVTFLAGLWFFLCWPISSRYPKYRHLVDPVKWVFWDIPTDAELSFKLLLNNAQTRLAEVERSELPTKKIGSNQKSEDIECLLSPDLPHSRNFPRDILSLRGHAHGVIGRLIISTEGMRFVQSFPKKQLWNHPHSELKEMSKLRDSAVSKLTKSSIEQIEFEFRDGTIEMIQGIKDRDEAFNTILGFSGLRWQALQLGTKVENKEKDADADKLKPVDRA